MGQSGRWVELTERDLSCLRWAVPIIRGVEDSFGEQSGTREGEAMSDVLASIVSRAEMKPTRHTLTAQDYAEGLGPLWGQLKT